MLATKSKIVPPRRSETHDTGRGSRIAIASPSKIHPTLESADAHNRAAMLLIRGGGWFMELTVYD